MSEEVKNCIESRRTAIFNYDITDQDVIDKVNDYFKRVEEFARDLKTANEFEAAFATSGYSQEYIDLFELILKYDTKANSFSKDAGDGVFSEVGEEVTHQARHKVRTEVDSALLDVPVVGDAINVKHKFDLFSKFRKKKDKDE